ncbi:hypothetical protein [Crocosphaera sp. Alani8]|uniref:hypothetical protein n=1 Tax=Crocosphaera sp. Alani8 TaxID=3038952 RepID=UPI00313F06BD
MTKNNEQQQIKEGLTIGNDANNQIADAIAARSAQMLEQALQENFETILESKMSIAFQETLNLHTQRSQVFAKKFLGTNKTQLAQHLVDTQLTHKLSSLQNNVSLEDIDDFDTDLLPEVGKLADETGAITVETNPESIVGF